MDIRIVKKSDAKELVEYINKISGESNFLINDKFYVYAVGY